MACSVDQVTFTSPDGREVDGRAPGADGPAAPEVALVVSVQQLSLREATQGTFTVALSHPPAGTVQVQLASSSDAKLVVAPSQLVFQPGEGSAPGRSPSRRARTTTSPTRCST